MSGATGGNSQILREFLLKLGYAEDESSKRKFGDAIKAMTLTVAGLGAAMVAAAAGVVAGVRSMANNANELYFVSQRTKASAQDIRALESAFTNLGGTAGQARAALEKLGDYVRASPGNVKYLESLTGKQWHDAASGMEELSEAFKRQMAAGTDIAVIMQEARQAGLSEADVLVLLQKDFTQTAQTYRKMADSILGDTRRQQAIVENAHAFTNSYNELSAEVNLFAVNFGDMLSTKLKPSIDKMKAYLVEHADTINAFLEKAATAISKVIGEMVHFATSTDDALEKLYKWFTQLTPEGKATAEAIAAVGAALLVLNTGLLKSPVGILITLGTALATLYNDYQKWKENKDSSLIDWGKWEPGITAATEALKTITGYISEGAQLVGGWTRAFEGLAAFVGVVWVARMGVAIASVLASLAPILAAMAVFGAATAAGYYIAHGVDNLLNDNEKAKEMAASMGLEEKFFGGYKDSSGKSYSVQDLAAMHARTRGPDSATQAQSAREGYDQYIAMGATPAIAAAMIAQEKRESGFDPSAIGDSGAARGLYQWHADRRNAMLAGSGIDVSTASAADQRKAAWWELHHGEQGALKKMLEQNGNVGATGAAATVYFERPRDRNEQGALGASLASEYDRAFGGTAPGTVPSRSPVAPLVLPPGTLPPTTAVSPSVHPSAYTVPAGADDHSSTMNQTNNINVHGDTGAGMDARTIAATIANSIGDKTARVMRNTVPNIV